MKRIHLHFKYWLFWSTCFVVLGCRALLSNAFSTSDMLWRRRCRQHHHQQQQQQSNKSSPGAPSKAANAAHSSSTHASTTTTTTTAAAAAATRKNKLERMPSVFFSLAMDNDDVPGFYQKCKENFGPTPAEQHSTSFQHPTAYSSNYFDNGYLDHGKGHKYDDTFWAFLGKKDYHRHDHFSGHSSFSSQYWGSGAMSWLDIMEVPAGTTHPQPWRQWNRNRSRKKSDHMEIYEAIAQLGENLPENDLWDRKENTGSHLNNNDSIKNNILPLTMEVFLVPGDEDMAAGLFDSAHVDPSSSSTTTGPLRVDVTSQYDPERSIPSLHQHQWLYTVRITNQSPTDSIQLLGRRFEIQAIKASMKSVFQGDHVNGGMPILKPGEILEYTSSAPLDVHPVPNTVTAARMQGTYRYITLSDGQSAISTTHAAPNGISAATAKLGAFHFQFPPEIIHKEKAIPDTGDEKNMGQSLMPTASPTSTTGFEMSTCTTLPIPPETTAHTSQSHVPSQALIPPTFTLPGDEDMKTGIFNDEITTTTSELVSDKVKVTATSSYLPDRSDALNGKFYFAYKVSITNNYKHPIQLISRQFQIQTLGSENKTVFERLGIAGCEPIINAGETFQYTSTAPLTNIRVQPRLGTTQLTLARMQGEYRFHILDNNKQSTTITTTSPPLNYGTPPPNVARLGRFHFVLPRKD